MGLFGSFKSSIGKLFGKATTKTIKPLNGRRSEQDAATHAQGQAGRRRKLLEKRVESGESQKVYRNRKPIDVLSTGIGPNLESVTREAFLEGYEFSRFASSNVWALTYDRVSKILYVRYMAGSGRKKSGPGRWYSYNSITNQEAVMIYNSASKGCWIWENLIGKGQRSSGRKPFAKDVKPPSYLPYGQKKRSNILQSP